MGSAGSVATAAGVKTAVSAGVVLGGACETIAGLAAHAATGGESEQSGQLIQDGLKHMKLGSTQITRDGVAVVSALTVSTVAAVASGTHRAFENPSREGFRAALKGTFIDAPVEVVTQVVHGRGVGGAAAGACFAAHGHNGSMQRAIQQQKEDAALSKSHTLEEIRNMGISCCFESEVPIWQLAELAAIIYDDPPISAHFKCDLPPIRDVEEDVDARMSVFIRSAGTGEIAGQRDLAVLVIRGTRDTADLVRDVNSIIGHAYPAAMVVTAAEIVKMYQGQGCHVMVTGHSLGGYLAEVVATTLGLNGAAFCAPGPGSHNGPKAGMLSGFHIINHEADHIGNHNHDLHQSPPVYVTDGAALMLPSKAHSMVAMLEYMKRREDWTNVNIKDKCQAEGCVFPFHVFDGIRSYRP